MASLCLLLLLTLVPISLAVLLLLAFAAWYRCRRPPKAAADAEKGGTGTAKVSDHSPAVVTKHAWEEIEAMTSGFSTAVIAYGGFSSVYLSVGLGPSLAIKVHNESDRLHAAFLRELDVLLHVRHPNIIRLTGFADRGEQGALVFEYVPNGTLHKHLHGGGAPLSWAHRMRVALQLAAALDYLHDGCDLQIVHNDVKPSNILLDADHNCKLCDFGSAKMGFASTVGDGEGARRRRITGTAGYVDPYYVRTGVLSRKSDVYSFGVVLLEMVSGREAFREETGAVLANVMRGVVREATEGRRVDEMVDGRLEGGFEEAEAVAVAAVLEGCLAEDPGRRPALGEVVRVLKEKVSVDSLVAC